MPGVRDYTELDVYKLSDQLERRVGELLDRPQLRADPDLHDQLKRSSEGPCPNIAEGFARFRPRENARFVRVAKGSLSETIVHLERAARKGLISTAECETLSILARRARGAATAYIRYLESVDPSGPA
jgi:four helix bundle protein